VSRAAAPQEREDWFDDAFVDDWLRRQEERAPERNRQFAMVRALVPRTPDESFRYLNLAAGDGALDELLLARYTHAQAVLVDGSPAMVTRAGARLGRFSDRVSLVQADLETPEWQRQVDGQFDVALTTIALHNLEDPRRIRALYSEVFRLIADGGFFMNLDYVRAPSHDVWPLYRRASSDTEGGYSMAIRSIRDYAGTVDEQLSWLREAGFAPVDCFWREFRLAIFGGFKGTPRIAD
jgi:tRNA (cmo5U34)-methyltransferase